MPFEFDHVAQQVPDIAAAVEWYQALIPGCAVIYQDQSWAFLDACGAKLAFVQADQHPGHVAWRVPDEELDALAQRFGAKVSTHRDGSRGLYLEAPGGQWVEIISYPKPVVGER
jgi:catechol 2,3-dioxygenase-like lactoylglutathione lyase family enzyme